MTSVVFTESGYSPPPPQVEVWHATGLTWTGWDGTTWDLTDPAGGVVAVSGGVVGLHFPAFEPQTSESPAVAGRRRRGVRTKERSIELPLLIWSDASSEEWITRDDAFWGGFSPEPGQEGTLTVTSPFGASRSIRCSLESDGGHADDYDPMRRGWVLYQLVLTAEQPYWEGPPLPPTSWGQTSVIPFFGPTGAAPPFYIAGDNRLEAASMVNPGDVAAWPVWTIGSVSGTVTITVTVDGGAFTVTVGSGSTVVINTDPANPVAILNGVTDVSGSVDPWNPRPIPAGAQVPIGFSMAGNGIVSAQITPRYYRARSR